MNRTAAVTFGLLVVGSMPLAAQQGSASPQPAPQADPIEEIVAAMRAAEGQLTSLRLEMTTSGTLPSGLEVTTKGVLHVLRGTQPAVHAALEYSFGDGVRGRVESSQTADGIQLFESDPAFGEVFLHIDHKLVVDLEWAGQVLDRADMPGMADRRALAPLGSSMLGELRRHFDFTIDARGERAGEAGTWLVGSRKPGLDIDDPDLPVADRIEAFVRKTDRALLEVVHRQGGKVVQHLVVDKLEAGLALTAGTFRVDGRGQRVRDVQQHQPLWEQIEQVLKQAEAKCEQAAVKQNQALPADRQVKPEVRPSRRQV